MTQLFNCIHSITIEFSNGQFYAYSKSQLPPIFSWTGVGPLYIASKNNTDKLAEIIGTVQSNSKVREQIIPDEKGKEFSDEEAALLEKTTKLWTIDWEENGKAYLTIWEPFPKTETVQYMGKAWRPVKNSEIKFSPSDGFKDIANKLIELA